MLYTTREVKPCRGALMPPKKKPKDRHRSGFMVRLPEDHKTALTELTGKTRRAITTEVQIALEDHYKKEGVKFPPGSGPAKS